MNDQRHPVQMLREHRQRRESRLQQEHRDAELLVAANTSPAITEATLPALRHPGRLAGAVTAWMSLTFLLCYIGLPMARAGLGLSINSLNVMMGTAVASFGGLLGVMALTLLGIAAIRPAAQLKVDPDRVLAATSGGLLVWGLLHNILPGLLTFSDMASGELLSFIGSNIIENALFGVMLASMARTGRGAFTLGVTFQAALFLFSYAAMFMMYV